MDSSKDRTRIAFFIVSILGTLYVLIELVLNLSNASLCASDGCRIVAQHARYGDITFLIPGLLVFLMLTLLSKPGSIRYGHGDRLISTILCAAIASEGFLVGYQVFRVHTPCWFCLGILAFFVVLGIIWIIAGRWEIITGFAGFAVILALFHLTLPVSNATGDSLGDHIGQSRLTLFYSSSCESCAEIETLCRECNIVINKVDADEHFDLLEGMNIYEIPVLFVNDDEEKRVLIGKNKITAFLSGNGDPATP
ncbi:MAG TPA: hypothetical protein PKZ42_02190 [Syntrophales bacterium]|nr:hypothetical protein [Syntrophales bacterium]